MNPETSSWSSFCQRMRTSNIWCQFHQPSTSRSQKCKEDWQLTVFFALLGYEQVKAARRMWMKLTPGQHDGTVRHKYVWGKTWNCRVLRRSRNHSSQVQISPTFYEQIFYVKVFWTVALCAYASNFFAKGNRRKRISYNVGLV